MTISTQFTRTLGIRAPIVCAAMQWVSLPPLAAAAAAAGALGILTALSQPSPEALREAIRETKRLLDGREGKFGVNITLLPSITPPDYAGYVKAAMDEGVDIFETAGNNPGPIIKLIQSYKAPGQTTVPKRYVIHKCTAVRHAISAQKMGVDFLSIDGFECAGHPGEDDIGNVTLLARAAQELKIPYIASGGFGDGRGLAAALALGAQGINMGTRFMATKECTIHQNIKDTIVASDERNTVHMFRTLKNTARVFKNKVSTEVVRLERRPHGAKFEELRDLVAGARGKLVYENGDPDYGIWSAGISIGLVKDIPSCQELVDRTVGEAEAAIADMQSKVVITERARL